MAAPSMGGVQLPRGNGQTVRLPARRLADRPRRADQRPARRAGHRPVPPGRDGHRDAVGQRRDVAAARCRDRLGHPGRQPRGRGPRAARDDFDLTFGDEEGDEEDWDSPSAGRDRHGSRRPRKDEAARRPAQRQRGGARGRWHHPAHRRLPDRHRAGGQRASGHLHRHPGSRVVHRDACPWREGHRHRRAGRRGRRRRHAADGRGAQPRPGRRGADRGRGEQDRQGGGQPRQDPSAAHRVRPGGRGVRRRHDVRRRLRDRPARASTSCSRRSC